MSLYRLPSGTRVREGKSFTLGGVQYPANWLKLSSDVELLGMGITPVVEHSRPDEQFYIVTENDDGTLDFAPRDLDKKKAEMVAAVKRVAGQILSVTDWHVIRWYETGTGVSDAVMKYRTNIRSAAGLHEAAINACTNVEGLAALKLDWPANSWDKI